MMFSHMAETHTDAIPVQFIILFDFDIIVWMLQLVININWSSHSPLWKKDYSEIGIYPILKIGIF